MRIEKADSSSERRLLVAAITNGTFLSRVAGRVGKEPLRSRYSNLIWSWCEEHYKKYQQAPGKAIESIYEEFTKANKDQEIQTLIDRFLSSLSGEHEQNGQLNVDHALDQAQDHLNSIRLERLREQIEGKIDKGDVDGALADQEAFSKINLRAPVFINVLEDATAQKEALDDQQKVLIRYPGAAGEFFGDELSEDSFIAFMAPPKGAKSQMMLDIAWRAMLQGQQVAYFQVGDLSRGQIMRRFHKRAIYRPIKAQMLKLPIGILLPPGERELATVEWVDKHYEKDVTWNQARKSFEKKAAKTTGRIRLSRHATKSITITEIASILRSWTEDDWHAKVVIIDYMENLANTDWKSNPIDQTAHNWAMARQISEVHKCLLVTASQTNKEGFGSWVLTRKNFRNSLMTLAHVTAFLGINSTMEERTRGIIRLNYVERRESEFTESHCLFMASCLAICNPCVVSTLPPKG